MVLIYIKIINMYNHKLELGHEWKERERGEVRH